MDPAIARWTTIDPKISEDYENQSPYASMYNNPVRVTDPLGDEGEDENGCCKVLKEIAANISGAIIGTIDNNIPASNLRGAVANSGIIQDPEVADAWNTGLNVSDVMGVVQGGGEMTLGGGLVGGGLIAAPETGTISLVPAALGAGLVLHGTFVSQKSASNLISQNGRVNIESGSSNNPYGSKGKPDHQDKVNELTKKAQSEAKPGETVVRERQIQGHDSRRRPDVQIVDQNGKARKVLEAERNPSSSRNQKREKEYKSLNMDHETHSLY